MPARKLSQLTLETLTQYLDEWHGITTATHEAQDIIAIGNTSLIIYKNHDRSKRSEDYLVTIWKDEPYNFDQAPIDMILEHITEGSGARAANWMPYLQAYIQWRATAGMYPHRDRGGGR